MHLVIIDGEVSNNNPFGVNDPFTEKNSHKQKPKTFPESNFK